MLKDIKRVLRIKSPSKVFQHEVGRNVGLGLIRGIEDTRAQLDRTTASLVNVPKARPFALGGSQLAGLSAAGGPGQTVVINPREGMSETQIGQTAARELGWMAKTA
jgi:hypothetical protein